MKVLDHDSFRFELQNQVQWLTSSYAQPRLLIVFDNVTTLPDMDPDSLSPQYGTDGLFGHDSS
jgi:hypothetical protein